MCFLELVQKLYVVLLFLFICLTMERSSLHIHILKSVNVSLLVLEVFHKYLVFLLELLKLLDLVLLHLVQFLRQLLVQCLRLYQP